LLLGDVTAAGCPAQCLRRLSKAPHEGAPHAFRIAEPDGGCDHFNRLDAALNAAFRCFRTQSLDGIGRGFAGRFMEGSPELSRAEARYRREPLNRQILGQVGLGEDEGSLDANYFAANMDDWDLKLRAADRDAPVSKQARICLVIGWRYRGDRSDTCAD
jgi:hypothetical protein